LTSPLAVRGGSSDVYGEHLEWCPMLLSCFRPQFLFLVPRLPVQLSGVASPPKDAPRVMQSVQLSDIVNGFVDTILSS
jgi:hypothetical protein